MIIDIENMKAELIEQMNDEIGEAQSPQAEIEWLKENIAILNENDDPKAVIAAATIILEIESNLE